MRLILIVCCVLSASAYADATEVSDVEAEQFYQLATPPASVPEFLKFFRTLAASGVYARDDFYTTETMKRLFGEQPRVEVLDDGVVTVVSVHGWDALVTGPNAYIESMPYMKGIWFEARKPDPNIARTWRRIEITFWGQFDGLDFKSVTQTLGPGWTRDTRGETLREFSRAEPFNPPPQPVTGYMGDSMITYPAGKALLLLEFDDSGQLHKMTKALPDD